MGSPQAVPLDGWLELSMVGSYMHVETFAAAFHPGGSTKPAPRRMIGREGELRELLAGGGVEQSRVDNALSELKGTHEVEVRPVRLSREKLRRYALLFDNQVDRTGDEGAPGALKETSSKPSDGKQSAETRRDLADVSRMIGEGGRTT